MPAIRLCSYSDLESTARRWRFAPQDRDSVARRFHGHARLPVFKSRFSALTASGLRSGRVRRMDEYRGEMDLADGNRASFVLTVAPDGKAVTECGFLKRPTEENMRNSRMGCE